VSEISPERSNFTPDKNGGTGWGAGPGSGVVSREIASSFGGRLIAKTAQPGAIVVGDKGEEVGVAFAMVEKPAVVGGAVLRHAAEMLAQAAG
jgi:hypothetical protein